MPADASESAVIVRVGLPPALERLRQRWDRSAAVGVPAHVTILYPFMPPTDLDAGVRRTIARIAAGHGPFDVRFSRVGRFPSVAYLAPEPPEPLALLTEAVHAAFPGFPPYGGAFDEVIPHLTIAESETAPLDDIAAGAEAALPFERHVTRLDVLVRGGEGRWHGHWRIPLGQRVDRPLIRSTGPSGPRPG